MDSEKFMQSCEAADPWLEAHKAIPFGYSITNKGVERKSAKEDQEGTELICGPLWVAARTRSTDGRNHGVNTKWVDRDGQVREKTIRQARLHEQSTSLAQELADEGLYIQPGKETHLKNYLALSKPDLVLQSVSRLGWSKDSAGKPVFARPDATITDGTNKQEKIIFQPASYCPTIGSMTSKGDLAGFRKGVVERTQGQPIILFYMFASLAAPLLKYAGVETGGFHIYGLSTGGKTTALQVSASVWGNGSDPQLEPENAFCQTWRATSNGLEGIADAHNDCVLCLDEIGKYEGDNFGGLIYDILGGKGKTRMTAEASAKEPKHWRFLMLSTGEMSVQDRIKQDGKPVKDGQLVRLVDIPVAGSVIIGLDQRESAELADTLKSICGASCYGVAGPEFIRGLLKKYEGNEIRLANDLRNFAESAASEILSKLGTNLPQTARRVIKRFGLVLAAGYLAQEILDLPLTQAQIFDAVMHVVGLWTGDGRVMQTEGERALEHLQSFLQTNQYRFIDANPIGKNAELSKSDLGYHVKSGELESFGLTDEGFKEACGQFSETCMVNALKSKELLFLNDKQNKAQTTVSGAGRVRLYRVDKKILDGDI